MGCSRLIIMMLACIQCVACGASFDDQRPLSDGATADSQGDSASLDGAGLEDGRAASDGLGGDGSVARVIARGSWAGRSGYAASGVAEIFQTSGGAMEVRLSADFSVSSVPGPVVVLTSRTAIGTQIEPSQGDLNLGTLQKNQGSQVYPVTANVGARRNVWVYCDPFGVEVALAELRDVP